MNPYEKMKHQQIMEAAAVVYAEAEAGVQKYALLRQSLRRWAVLKRLALCLGPEKHDRYLEWEIYEEKLSYSEAKQRVRDLNKREA